MGGVRMGDGGKGFLLSGSYYVLIRDEERIILGEKAKRCIESVKASLLVVINSY